MKTHGAIVLVVVTRGDIVRLGILDRNNTLSETVNGELEEFVAFTAMGAGLCGRSKQARGR
jgi:hypothetical protein